MIINSVNIVYRCIATQLIYKAGLTQDDDNSYLTLESDDTSPLPHPHTAWWNK